MNAVRGHVETRTKARRAAALLELLLAIVLFVAAAALIMRSTRTALDRVTDSAERIRAIDLAQSRLAELTSGIMPLQQAQNGIEIVSPWAVEVSVETSPFDDLSLVVVTVRPEAEVDSFSPVTLRQLVRSDVGRLEIASSEVDPEL